MSFAAGAWDWPQGWALRSVLFFLLAVLCGLISLLTWARAEADRPKARRPFSSRGAIGWSAASIAVAALVAAAVSGPEPIAASFLATVGTPIAAVRGVRAADEPREGEESPGVPGWIMDGLTLLHRRLADQLRNDRLTWIHTHCRKRFDECVPTANAPTAVAAAEIVLKQLEDLLPEDSSLRDYLIGSTQTIGRVQGWPNERAEEAVSEMRTTTRKLLGFVYDWGYDSVPPFNAPLAPPAEWWPSDTSAVD
ncbi:hypothetical protein AB0C70_39755 [Streptomyces sp. NPDC048564]|uniref:hypothetical protein n=1 Tax=Streptomyces sp. NPDC048564 TaxID=3155760 RepID=UPI00344A23EC